MGDSLGHRRLAAILAADVAGYTRLVEQDTDGTVAAWKAVRDDVIKPGVDGTSGRIIKFTGDGFLAEFPSVQDAVTCAIALQNELKPSSLNFRMGINVGDITDDGGDVHGEGVNIAARLEALDEPGGICISGDVYNQILNRIDNAFTNMGEREVKHVSRPVRVYSVDLNGASHEPENLSTEILETPDIPSIAVLPFDNMSGDPEQEYFSDGIVEDIITALSGFRSIFVIARNSSFTYKGKAVDIKKVGIELGVRYVLEGSVRKSASRVRITAQLIEADTGTHLWAERYDRTLEDVFDLQDEITETIVAAIRPELEIAEQERARKKPASDLGAWEHYQRGMWYAYKFEAEYADKAEACFNDALKISPRYAPALSGLAWVDFFRAILFFPLKTPISRQELLQRGLDRAADAIKADDKDAFPQFVYGRLLSLTGEFDEAIERLSLAIEINPNHAMAYHGLGYAYALSGQPEEAVQQFDTALRLSPHDPYRWAFMTMKAFSLMMCRRFDEATEWGRRAIQICPDQFWPYVHVIIALAHSGKLEEAKQTFSELKKVKPDFSRAFISETIWFRHEADLEFVIEGLRMAGMED